MMAKQLQFLSKKQPGFLNSKCATAKLCFLGFFTMERKVVVDLEGFSIRALVALTTVAAAATTVAKPKLWTEKLDTPLGLLF